MEEFFKNWFQDAEGNLNNFQALAAKYLPVLITFVIASFIISALTKLTKKIVYASKIPKNLHGFIVSGIKILLYFLVILMICSRLGIDVTSLIAAFSIVGVAVSLSIQNTLANVMAGFSLLATKQFNVDDYVDIGGVAGTVVKIGLSCCKIKTYDGKDIYVPNSNIISTNIINYTKEPYRRVDITIGTSYSEKVDKVKNALSKIVESTPEVIKDKDIFVGLTNFGASSIDYTIRVWVKNQDYWNAYFSMLEAIKRVFEEEGIEIPFNQLDVHLKNE